MKDHDSSKPIIHPAYNRSEVVRRYYEMLGEEITTRMAHARWGMLRHPDKKILRAVLKNIAHEQEMLFNGTSGL